MTLPDPPPPAVLDAAALQQALKGELQAWTALSSPHPSGRGQRQELHREFRFSSFQAAIAFMARLAPICDRQDHHPRWENTWRTLKVWLCTHEGDLNGVTERDLRLARAMEKGVQEEAARPL